MAEPFPSTRWSAIRAAAGSDAAQRQIGFDRVVRAYWRPLYVYLRLKHRLEPADAQDATQSFLAHVWNGKLLSTADPERARFRTFLRLCLDRWISNERRAAFTLKRGGGVEHLSLDFATIDAWLERADDGAADDPETRFEQEWSRSIYEQALEQTRRLYAESGQQRDFEMFERYALGDEPLTYEALAQAYGLTVATITNRLSAARRRLRTAILELLRDLTLTDEEYREEAQRLLGVEPP